MTIEHHSMQQEAGMARDVRCRIQVVAAGSPLAEQAERFALEDQVRVRGFLARASERRGPSWLVLHARVIESISELQEH